MSSEAPPPPPPGRVYPPPPGKNQSVLERLESLPLWAKITLIIVVLLFVGAGIDAANDTSESDEPKAEKKAAPAPEPTPVVEEVEFSVEDAARLVDGDEFCAMYANGLAAGASEDFLFGNFLKGFQQSELPDDVTLPPAREIFDELAGDC